MVVEVAKGDGSKMERVAEGVYRRNGRYIVPIWNPAKGEKGGKDWHTLPRGSSLTDAKRYKRQAEDDKRNGRNRNGGLLVEDWAGRYEQGKWVSGRWLERCPRKADATNMHNDERVRTFAKRFEGRELSSITEEEAQQFALDHPSSFKEVRAMFNDACRLKLADGNPFDAARIDAKRGREDIQVLTELEIVKLANIARAVHGDYGDQFAAMIQTAAWTGMRPGELYLLGKEPGEQRNHVDLRAKEIHIEWALNAKTGKVTRPKYESQRVTLLLPGAEKAIRSVDADDLLFTTKRGYRFSQRTFFYYWEPVRAAFTASLPATHWLPQRIGERGPDGNLDFYELRHFFGTKLAWPPEGVRPASPYEIADQMGHKDGGKLAMRVYIHKPSDEARQGLRSAWAAATG